MSKMEAKQLCMLAPLPTAENTPFNDCNKDSNIFNDGFHPPIKPVITKLINDIKMQSMQNPAGFSYREHGRIQVFESGGLMLCVCV